ncbi:MAG: glycosyltransferase [Ilumatobacteraceae bacterium]
MRRALVLLATMSESDTIESVLGEVAAATGQLSRLDWSFRVLVVDDGGSGEFHELCRRLGTAFGLELDVVDGPRAGLGGAVLHGFAAALEDPSVDYVINLDADGQHDARQMGDLLRAHIARGAGITIGSRWTRGGRCYGLSPARRVLSRASAVALHLAGVPRHVKDPTTSFRVYGRGVVEAIRRDITGFSGFSFFGAAIAVAHSRGYEVIETPIIFRPRLGGRSNLRTAQVARAVRDLPEIASVAAMVRRRQRDFLAAGHGAAGPDEYNAARELEVLSATPVSTGIILDELLPHIGADVLEVGAGLGLVTERLVAAGRRVTALEPDPSLHARIGQRAGGATVLNATLATSGLAGTFDTVLYVNVLEHIEDDTGELVRARGMLRDGGNVVIFVPAMPSLYGTMDAVSGHHRRYRRRELSSVIRSAGLRPVSVRSFDAVGIVPYWLAYRVVRRRVLGGAAVGVYDRIIIPLSRAVSRITGRRGPGKNLIAVGSSAA